MNTRLVLIIAIIIFGAILLSGLFISPLKNQEIEVKAGERYLYSLDYDNEDPFEEIRVDTVKVIGIKNGYVQWEYKNGIRLSCKLKYFKHWTRVIKHHS